MHKTHSGGGKPTRSFMVFLDRKVGNSLILVTALALVVVLALLVAAVVSSGVLVFYFWKLHARTTGLQSSVSPTVAADT